jgi:serine/threonine protein kinase
MQVCPECQRCYDDTAAGCAEVDHPELGQLQGGDPGMVAGYRLEYLLSSTGKSQLYRAIQTKSAGPCLIRVVDATEKNLVEFVRAAKRAAEFFHPGVAAIYEIGDLPDGEVFVVSEEPDGTSLLDLIREKGTPELLHALCIGWQTAEALHALHQHGLVHRAVNPANIFLSVDAGHGVEIKLRAPDLGGIDEYSIAADKFLKGGDLYPLRYFAPEQCMAEPATAQTDVYSLGVVFYEMLAGVPPFEGASAAALIHAHTSEPPPEMKIANFGLRMLLSHALTESLHKSPASRQSSANAFARQLRHIEQLETHVSTPPPAGSVSFSALEPAAHAVSHEPVAVKIKPETTSHEVCSPSHVAPERLACALLDEELPSGDDVLQALSEEACYEPVVYPTKTASFVEPSKPSFEQPRSRMKVIKKRLRRAASDTPIERPSLSLCHPVNVPKIKIGRLDGGIAPIFKTEAGIMPTKVDWQTPDDDIPSFEDVLEVRASEDLTAMPVAVQAAPLASANVVYLPGSEPVAVSAQPLPKKVVATFDDPAAVLYSLPEPSPPMPPFYRSRNYGAAFIAGIVVMIVGAFVLFGNKELVRDLQSPTTDKRVAAKTVALPPVRREFVQPTVADDEPNLAVVNTAERASTNLNDRGESASKPSPSKAHGRSTARRTPWSYNPALQVAEWIPSTRVIYVENGVVKSKTVSDHDPTASQGTTKRPDRTSRSRIVVPK